MLGKSMSRRFLELGASVVICGRRQGVLDETATEFAKYFPDRIARHVCDIRDASQVEAMAETLWAARPLGALVNNAAGQHRAHRDAEPEGGRCDPERRPPWFGLHDLLACGKRWLAAGHHANVLSIVTTYAWTGSAYVVPSAMAKAGVLCMTRSLAVEWGGRGIRLNAIAQGPFPTPGAWERLVGAAGPRP